MKKIFGFFRKAIGWPLFFWGGLFFVWLALQIIVQDYYADKPLLIDDMDRVLLGFDFAGIVLKMWFLGYFFCVASRTASGVAKPLYPLALKDSFVMGVHVLFRLIFFCLPLIAASYVTYYFRSLDAENFFYWFSLTYILFMIVPFCLYFVSHTEPLPYLFKGTFLKSWDYCFYFTMLVLFSYMFGIAFLDWAVELMFDSVSARFSLKSLSFASLIYVAFFYMILFNALLLGLFSKKAIDALEDKPSVKKEKVSEKAEVAAAPVVQKTVAEKQPVKKQKVVRKVKKTTVKATIRKAAAKTAPKKTTKKTTTKKTTTKKVVRKKGTKKK